MTDERFVPAFAPGTRLRFDEVRDTWLVLAPERVFVPDDTAVEVLRLVDGTRDLRAIVDALAARFPDAEAAEIAADVAALVADLQERGMLRA